MADFLGKSSLTENEIDVIVAESHFDKMRKNPMVNFEGNPDMNPKISPFFRKGDVGEHKTHLSEEHIKYIDMLFEKHFPEGFLVDNDSK